MALWSSLIEKAYAVVANNTYAGIHRGNSGDALKHITGLEVDQLQIQPNLYFFGGFSEDSLLEKIGNALNRKQAVVLGTPKGSQSGTVGLVDDHAFVPIKVNYSQKTVDLYNPQDGKTKTFSVSVIRKYCDFIWITKI
ncbi:hypothetical protein K9N68_39255 (plasmid) [Kovacikia minuta CCNUW1]|uniref:C2 family cysteine protease n=1 Tax=Kovacikia minuta TaxID=2931930 RepID=UPI001CCB256F|nr:C2 family cysteine protease [Kovacikia minuta]UBF30714.1 hypothetical protein K9N68_39255 [Kovacikia minuta CCNUW1]